MSDEARRASAPENLRDTIARWDRMARGRGTDEDFAMTEALAAAMPIGDAKDLELWERVGRVLREHDRISYQLLKSMAVGFAATIGQPLEN